MGKRNRISLKNGQRKITGSRRRLAYFLWITKTGHKCPPTELKLADGNN